MKALQYLLLITVISTAISCTKKSTIVKSNPIEKKEKQDILSNYSLVSTCYNYVGTPYKFGGEDKSGMDCSGLIYAAFQLQGKAIPRVSYVQAEYFKEIELGEMQIGDLVYFKVGSSRINHTGIISKVKSQEEVYFLHASTSKGVREDNLFSNYWFSKIAKLTRP